MTKFLINFRYAFRPNKPILTLRLVWRFIEILVFKKQPLRYVDFAIGYRCNLKCEHCFAADKADPKRGRMPPSHFAKVVKDAMKLGAVNFSFQGGEPLIYDDLKLYIKAAQPDNNLISVTTNGTLLTLEKARELKSCGVDIVTISYDEMRDPVKFWIAHKNAKEAGLMVTHGITATKAIVGRLSTIAGTATWKKTIAMLIFPVPMGRWSGKDVMLSDEDIAKIRAYTKKYPYLRTDFQANYVHEGCGAAREILFINPYGDVYTCPFINIPFGNLKNESIKKIREKMLCEKMFQGYSQHCIAGEGKGIRGAF